MIVIVNTISFQTLCVAVYSGIDKKIQESSDQSKWNTNEGIKCELNAKTLMFSSDFPKLSCHLRSNVCINVKTKLLLPLTLLLFITNPSLPFAI